mgnify:CR=1 FL=1
MDSDTESEGADDESQGGHSHRSVFLDQRSDQEEIECSHHRTAESEGNADQGVPSNFQLIEVTVGKQEDDSNEGSDPADNFRSTDRRLVDDSVHHHNKDRHGGDNRGDLKHGSKNEGPVENELGHGHPENRKGNHKKGFSKTACNRLRDSI